MFLYFQFILIDIWVELKMVITYLKIIVYNFSNLYCEIKMVWSCRMVAKIKNSQEDFRLPTIVGTNQLCKLCTRGKDEGRMKRRKRV